MNPLPRLNRSLVKEDDGRPSGLVLGPLRPLPERVIQFGEGVFIRGYFNWMLQVMNRQGLFGGNAIVLKPRTEGDGIEHLNAQEGLYTLWTRGRRGGRDFESLELISSISRGINPGLHWADALACAAEPGLRFAVSNTTEEGLRYFPEAYDPSFCPQGYPAKLAAFLFQRYQAFQGRTDKGLIVMPFELVENNGAVLKAAVLQHASDWRLGPEFVRWIHGANRFINTLVDRIVPGRPEGDPEDLHPALNYDDRLLICCEPYHLLVVEAEQDLGGELPLSAAGLNVRWVGDLTPYRELKVRILNGAHTFMALVGFLDGSDTVGDCLIEEGIRHQVRLLLFDEVAPLLHVPEAEARDYVNTVLERFQNPFLSHALSAIGLNCTAKFKARILPSLLEHYRRRGTLPAMAVLALAGLFVYMRGERAAGPYEVRDSETNREFFAAFWKSYDAGEDREELCYDYAARADFWGADLSVLPGLVRNLALNIEKFIRPEVETAPARQRRRPRARQNHA